MGFSGGGGGNSTPTIVFGLDSTRPAASPANANTFYYATNVSTGGAIGALTMSDGAAWHEITAINGTPHISPIANGQINVVGSNVNVNGGGVDIQNVGAGLHVAEGANAKQGVATLAAGTVTVANTSTTATSRIFVEGNADGGAPGWSRVSARTAGTSFTITSSSATDTSSVAYEIFEVG
ncbi:MAG: hypothetical protein KGL39_32125 [Patescibacteria group bacterium]|nr:hypothetical protein [Patescibacteria group bacterium]